jgi:hypothetical protein
MSTEEERCPEPRPWVPSRLAFFLHLFSFLFFLSSFGDRGSPLALYPLFVTARNRPILIRLSAITPKPTQRCMPASP